MEIRKYSSHGLNFIEVTNRHFMKVTLCNLGASLYDFTYHNENIVLSNTNLDDFKKPTNYYGKTLGRLAGNYKGNIIKVGNRNYYLAQNDGINTLNGGFFGISQKFFKPEIIEEDDKVIIEYTVESMDYESGFPGTLSLLVRYIVFNDEDILRIEYDADSDRDTILNISPFNYFCLNETSCRDINVTINADQYYEAEAKTLIPTNIKDVEGSIYDFRKKRILADYLLREEDTDEKTFKGYDNIYLLNERDGSPAATLETNRYTLDFYTSYDGLYFGTDNQIDNVINRGQLSLNHRGVIISPRIAKFENTTLEAFDKYVNFIEMRINRK